MWDREHVRAVQIDCPETLGIADRADFYDHTGAVLDMLVTHLFQVAAEVAMEPPASLEPADLQAARESIIAQVPPDRSGRRGARPVRRLPRLAGVAPVADRDLRRGQALGRHAALAGVPFLLRTGKRLHQTHQTVSLSCATGRAVRRAARRRQRRCASARRQRGDRPADAGQGARRRAEAGRGDAASRCLDRRPQTPLPPYVRLLHDVLNGDRSLVTRPDGLAHVWKVAAAGARAQPAPVRYAPGSWGRPRPQTGRSGRLAAGPVGVVTPTDAR